MDKKIPMRTCIVCRGVKPKNELVRIVKNGDVIAADLTGKANGRGAYVCNNPECVKRLKKTRALNRTFSCAVEDAVYDKLTEALVGNEN